MKGTVNPFEPWRPVVDQTPPPLHVARPWRPPTPPPAPAAVEEPPIVEPAKRLPRNKPPERSRVGLSQPSARSKPNSQRQRDLRAIAGAFFWTFLLLCLMLGLGGMLKWLGASHYFRLVVPLLVFTVSIRVAWRRDWYTRLSWMAAGLALAGVSAWFVPTMRGVNLWSAYRQMEELRALPAGDVASYQREAAARRTLVEEFPSFSADMKAAEQAWLRRTVDEAIESSDRKLDKDPDTALAHLHRLDKDLSQLENYSSVRKDLESARRRAVQACAKKVAQQH